MLSPLSLATRVAPPSVPGPRTQASLSLAQVGELSVFIAGHGYREHVLSRHSYLLFVAVTALSLALTPLLFKAVVALFKGAHICRLGLIACAAEAEADAQADAEAEAEAEAHAHAAAAAAGGGGDPGGDAEAQAQGAADDDVRLRKAHAAHAYGHADAHAQRHLVRQRLPCWVHWVHRCCGDPRANANLLLQPGASGPGWGDADEERGVRVHASVEMQHVHVSGKSKGHE